MRTEPLVSVVVAVFNYGDFIDDALSSVVEQPYRPIEVIVVDDGSTDGSGDRAAAHPDVTVIRQPNRGVAAARNRGVAASGGEFVTFLDADDAMIQGGLSALVSFMLDNPHVAAAIPRQLLDVEGAESTPSWAQADLLRGDPAGVPHSAGLYRRDCFDPLGWFDETLRTGEFFELLTRLPDVAAQVAYLDTVGLRRRVHDRNLTHGQTALQRNMFASLKARIDRGRS